MNKNKGDRLPNSFWHMVNRPTRKTGTGALIPCPTHSEVINCSPRVVASKEAIVAGR